uniref:Coiled-coil domain-containing protein 15 n=1 Tax=Biomphalaria glabrata TaxID=6526 RepID=A0A2C9M7L0_BIOGL
MASKQLQPRNISRIKRREKKNVYSVISTDVMGNRNVEIVPVGAWVEPADCDIQPNAVLSAQMEEEKISRLKEEKENRLRSFQKEVKQRLTRINRLKKEQQIRDAERAFEQERKVVQQSFLTGDTLRVDTCTQRQDLDKAIMKRLLEKYGEDVTTWDRVAAPSLQSQTEENHMAMDKARQQLISKKLEQRKVVLGNSDNQNAVMVVRHVQNPTVKSVTHMAPSQKCVSRSDVEDRISASDTKEFVGTQSEEEQFVDQNDSDTYDFNEEPVDKGRALNFSDSEARVIKEILRKSAGKSKRPTSARLDAILKNEAKNEIQERQRKQQAAISRRIFMDREREAVRENIRREIQRKRIISLKKEKEEYREALEEMAQQELDTVCPGSEELEEERKLREELEEMQVREMVTRRKEELKKSREMERYLDALRHKLLEKVKKHNIELPALCACGDTLWDTHPETCANNCFFYKNQRAYVRALQSVISSIEVK